MQPNRVKLTILFMFLASGASGLVYEIVWLRMLSRLMGVTLYATSIVLAAFMAGLAIGSFLFGRFIDGRKNPLLIYAILEIIIAAVAFFTPHGLDQTSDFYMALNEKFADSDFMLTASRAGLLFLLLLIPTTLMGGTLPILMSFLTRKEGLFGKNLSLLYGFNTLGAVIGVLLSGFVTIGLVGEKNTILVGVVINVVVGLIAFILCRSQQVPPAPAAAAPTLPSETPEEASEPVTDTITRYGPGIRRLVLVSLAMSGFTALAYEVIWTRQLLLFLQTSIYAFAGMLAVFLTGIALGSMLMNRVADRLKSPLAVFGALEVLVGILSVANLYLFVPFDGARAHMLLGYSAAIWATVIIVLPLTVVFGMTFPTASVCHATQTSRSGSAVGRLYSANTLGSIIGSLLAGFVFIPMLGSTKTVVALAGLNMGLGLLLLVLERGRAPVLKLVSVPLAVGAVLLGLPYLKQTRDADPFYKAMEQKVRQHYAHVQRIPMEVADREGIRHFLPQGRQGGDGHRLLAPARRVQAPVDQRLRHDHPGHRDQGDGAPADDHGGEARGRAGDLLRHGNHRAVGLPL